MSTRSMIGKENEDGTIRAIYCHYDGYPEGVGQTLADFYTDKDKIDALLNLGNLSVLRQEIGNKQDFNDYKNHNENWCLAYGRDRGEANQEAKVFNFRGDYLDYARSSWAEYAYIYTKIGWAWWSLTTPEPTTIKPSLVVA